MISKGPFYTCAICGMSCRSFIRYLKGGIICAYCQEKELTDIRTYLIIKKLKEQDPVEYKGGFEYDPMYDY
jgi:hypothetical protein